MVSSYLALRLDGFHYFLHVLAAVRYWIGYFLCSSVLQTSAGSLSLGLSAKGQGSIQFAQGNAGGDDQIRVSSMTVILELLQHFPVILANVSFELAQATPEVIRSDMQ